MKKILLTIILTITSFSANALDVDDANCALLISHFEIRSGWFSGLTVQNLADQNQVTVRSYSNNPLGGGGDSLAGLSLSANDFTLAQAEKRPMTLAQTNPGGNPNVLGVNAGTGFLFVLSEKPVAALMFFGKGVGSQSVAIIGPLESTCQ